MALKIDENAINEVTIKFSCASEYTVEIKIEDVFTTELTFKEKVYDERCYPNEDYDGYSDTARYIYVNEKTKFFNTIIESIKNELEKKLELKIDVVVGSE